MPSVSGLNLIAELAMTNPHRVARLMLFCFISACSAPRPADKAPPADPASVKRSLDSLLAAHGQHFISGNLDSLVSAYSENAIVRPAHMEPMRGRQAIRTSLEGWLKAAPIKTIAYTSEDLAVYGDTAFQITSYKGTMQPPGSSEISDHGTCVLFWVRESNVGWRIHRSTCSSSVPLPAPASPGPARRN